MSKYLLLIFISTSIFHCKSALKKDDATQNKKSIYIHNFQNATYYSSLVAGLKNNIAATMNESSVFTVTQNKKEANYLLYGKIEVYDKQIITSQRNKNGSAILTLGVSVKLYKQKNKTHIFLQKNLFKQSSFVKESTSEFDAKNLLFYRISRSILDKMRVNTRLSDDHPYP